MVRMRPDCAARPPYRVGVVAHFRLGKRVGRLSSRNFDCRVLWVSRTITDDKSASQVGSFGSSITQDPTRRKLRRVTGPHENSTLGDRADPFKRSLNRHFACSSGLQIQVLVRVVACCVNGIVTEPNPLRSVIVAKFDARISPQITCYV
jgi:hypothetical protein